MKPSWRARFMNGYLRLTEKTHLARERDFEKLRRSFEWKAWFSFHGPWGAVYQATTLGGRPALKVAMKGHAAGPVILYFHGGAHVMGSPQTHKAMLAHLCKKAGAAAILSDYRKAPEHVFPSAVDDAVAAYGALLASGIRPKSIVLGGDSAGGNIVLALLGEICRQDLAQPAGVFALSPVTDMSFSGASVVENVETDPVLPAARIADIKAVYLAGADPETPRASPLFADFTGACPVWLCVGSTEILRDDSRRMAEKIKAQGGQVTFIEEEGLAHVWPLFHGYMPEADRTLGQIAGWINSLSGSRDGS